MGILKHVLFWPVTGPQFLIKYSLGQVEGVVKEELTDDQAIKEDLMALQMRVELGEVDDEEYAVYEEALMQRLRDVRHWREEFGMGTSGGPVRVRADESPTDGSPNVAEDVIASPEGTDDTADEDDEPRGGVADPSGASVEVNFDWE
jgi:hypothetical protein